MKRVDYDDRMEVYDDGAFTVFKSHYGHVELTRQGRQWSDLWTR